MNSLLVIENFNRVHKYMLCLDPEGLNEIVFESNLRITQMYRKLSSYGDQN